MLQVDRKYLPSSTELPDSDDTPVDNVGVPTSRSEDQNWLPNVLLLLLKYIWADRTDWFFGIDMGVYHPTGLNHRFPVVPDGFLSLGVERRKGNKSRRSYVLWEENDIPPILTLEVVSWTPGGEYEEKMAIYAKLGVLYYVIYNPEYWQRDRHQPFEVYKLVDGAYQLQIGEPYWFPEIGLGIGRCQEISGAVEQEVLSWFDAQSHRYLCPEELAQIAAEEARLARQEAEDTKAQLAQALTRIRELEGS
ncbi:Uma2 family endonuclease [Chamaesiphon sp. OTE_75_metabat_556]|uniref:Uma2 family endonuclease n=1 Tax=Chamaesiphon sp. OTE_75_metabat_556 TaxID=2964692 RepID=UPI00286D2DDD|nr:Uma2 family endonuclease [Chamaesiphon sp. OTE_75_metabat_556]